ncbi:helix-turn-helix transcriptional regulator [Streptomyces sp. 549]|uniref:PadR family transcriptional regulator n=1 Tax=Streptomyces sp. 549 TaxID=3049076 RepID=UPI0024C2D218|nr:PadR family transcriptional regulator [Streptomyces sp. 549]MDK1476483.1 helix-turn-helix transcriptional regulator [Streptomyces sp. 549]
MPPVFAHGRLRLYLLKLLDEAPRHGYEVIRLLEERFEGLYAPSAGTVYPRLAKLSAEGLVSHATEGGRKVYSITDTGRRELADRQAELAELEMEIHESLAALAREIREDVRGTANDVRREMREAAREARAAGEHAGGEGTDPQEGASGGAWGDSDAWRQAKEEMRRATHEWKEQARRARAESRKAKEDAAQARRDAQRDAQEEVRRIARQVQDHVQSYAQEGDWQRAVREGMAELSKEMGTLGRLTGSWPPYGRTGTDTRPSDDAADASGPAGAAGTADPAEHAPSEHGTTEHTAPEHPAAGSGTTAGAQAEWHSGPAGVYAAPDWAAEPAAGVSDPARELTRLLDRFRDDIRDASRDHGVDQEQLREARRHLSTAAAHIGVVLRPPHAH